jgi:YD repeat-containing protein
VDCASGDFYHIFDDVSVPGYGPQLGLLRTYNSLGAGTEGIFGYGWSTSYDSNLVVDSNAVCAADGDSNGCVTITEDDGSSVTANPNGSGGFNVPSWADSTLSMSGSNYVFARQATATFTYNSSGQLTSIADLNGATTNLSYTSGKLHTVTDPTSRALTFAYGTNGLVSTVTDPLSRVTTYSYDGSNNLTSVSDPMSRVTSFTYGTGSSAHLLLTMKLPNGQSGGPDAGDVSTNTYDSSGRILTETDPAGRETTYAYAGANFSDSGGTTTITDPDGNVTLEDYMDGQMIAKAIGSSTWLYSYDQNTFGRTFTEDPNGNGTSSSYDSTGNLVTSTNGLGNTSSFSYNSLKEQTCAATALASSPCSALSPPSAVSPGGTITPPSSAPPKFVTYKLYDTNGNELYQTTGDYAPGSGTASQSRTTYNLYNGNSVTLSGTSDSCTTSAPSTELPCATINANGVVTQLTYDSAGDLASRSTPDGNAGSEKSKTTYSYDADGEQTSSVAPKGNLSGANAGNYTTATAYDADGEPTTVTVGGASGATVIPRVTTYSYDGNGNQTSATHSTSIGLIGATSGTNSSSSLALTLPKAALPGDQAVLTTTTGSVAGPWGSLFHLSANDLYTVAGNGTASDANDSSQATESELNVPISSTIDSAGNLYIGDQTNQRIQEVPAANGTQWGISMIAGDAYTIAGSATGSVGHSGNGGASTSALLSSPSSAVADSSGNVYIAD